jgi:hypothetical protein
MYGNQNRDMMSSMKGKNIKVVGERNGESDSR